MAVGCSGLSRSRWELLDRCIHSSQTLTRAPYGSVSYLVTYQTRINCKQIYVYVLVTNEWTMPLKRLGEDDSNKHYIEVCSI